MCLAPDSTHIRCFFKLDEPQETITHTLSAPASCELSSRGTTTSNIDLQSLEMTVIIPMLRVVIMLLDLVMVFSMLTAMFSNTSTLFDFGLILLLVLRVWLNITIGSLMFDLIASLSAKINALLEPTSAAQGDRCPICFDDFFKPHRISCNHVFCHDCALLMFCKRDTCPLCLRAPLQLGKIEEAASLRDLFGSCCLLVELWLTACFLWSFA